MTTTACRDNPDGGDAERDAPLTAEEWARMDDWIAAHQFPPTSADFSSDPSVSLRARSMTRDEIERDYPGVILQPYQTDEIAAAREIGYPHIVRDGRIIGDTMERGKSFPAYPADGLFARNVFIDEAGRLTPDTMRRLSASLSKAIIPPAVIGGRAFYGAPMSLQRERFEFIPHLIRNLRNTL